MASTKSKDAIIQITLRDLNKRQTPEQFLRDQFKQDLKSGKVIQTDSYKGYTAIVEANTPYGRRATRVGVVFQDNQVYQVFAVAEKDSDLSKYDASFLQTIKSIRALKPSEVKLAEERTIKIINAQNGDTFDKLAEQSPLTSHAEEQLRLLNGVYPDGEPVPGQPLKIVQ